MKPLLRLFNAVLVDKKERHYQYPAERTVKNGYILEPFIEPSPSLLDEIESVIGLSGEKANASFHKSWKVVRDSSEEELFIHQIVHYITTYDFEALGIYRQDTVYIPAEELKLPKIKDDIPLVVIHALTAEEVLAKIVELGSGIALSQSVLDDILAVVRDLKFAPDFVEKIKNRELKALLYNHYGIVPTDPTEFLRHLISRLTGESLLIKNNALIAKIKAADGALLDELIQKSPPDLATIFLRYKPLFLAMKSISRNKTFFNRLRKQANKLHKPSPTVYLNGVTCAIKHNSLQLRELEHKLNGASIYSKIRLARALRYRLSGCDSIVYQIRNGRGWATDFGWIPNELTSLTYDIVFASIAESLDVKGKTIYIPPYVSYALPATEKQFVGNIPFGSYVSVPQDLIVGVHWINTARRIDVDLSIIGESGKFGWDARYRSESCAIMFSGDMATAPPPDGASELFYAQNGVDEPRVIFVNYYNFDRNDPLTIKLFVANEKPGELKRNYTVNPNSIVATANVPLNKKQNILGLVTTVGGENRVYFANVSIGNSITSSDSPTATKTRKWLVGSMVNGIELNAALVTAGAKVVSERPKETGYIDLSPSALDKTTILNLLRTG